MPPQLGAVTSRPTPSGGGESQHHHDGTNALGFLNCVVKPRSIMILIKILTKWLAMLRKCKLLTPFKGMFRLCPSYNVGK
jgi:hypothetical protein